MEQKGDERDFITQWNLKFPLDRWWREKYKIPFGSEQHLAQRADYIRFDFEEDKLYKETRESRLDEDKYVPGCGQWLKKREALKMTEDEVVDLFDNIDIESIEESENGEIIVRG